jgi:hypothetical protein
MEWCGGLWLSRPRCPLWGLGRVKTLQQDIRPKFAIAVVLAASHHGAADGTFVSSAAPRSRQMLSIRQMPSVCQVPF